MFAAEQYNPGQGAPYYYDYINAMASQGTPTEIHAYDAMTTRYYRRYLLQQAISVFEWQLPKHWDRDFFLYVLYCFGFLAVIETNKYGVLPQPCGLGGRTVQYQPRYAVIANELLGGIKQPVIDEQCTLIKLMPDYGGILDLVNAYAEKLALADEALGMNLINSKLAYVFTAGNKAGAESFKKLYDEIHSGKPMAVYDKTLVNEDGSPAWSTFTQNIGGNFIAPDLLLSHRQLLEEFNTIIGIPNANKDKRERLNVAEVNANNVETESRAALWLQELQTCLEKTRDMFGISEEDLSVDWRENLREGGGDDGGNLSFPSGAVQLGSFRADRSDIA